MDILLKTISLQSISFYQKWISILFPARCRFYPTCSEYSKECFEHFSWSKAFYLSMKRLLRCHPYCEGGIDRVPLL